MGSFTDYLENALLDHVFGTGEGKSLSYTQPDKYIALCTVAVTDTATGATITEPSSPSYSRVIKHTWDLAAAGATENTSTITFAQATANWGTILDFAICDAVTGGNVIAYGSLTISKSVASGDTPKFASGDIDVTLS
jgi:hypothetical protein